MYNSIQQFINFGTGKIEERIKSFIEEKKDLADLVIGLQEELFELGRNIVREVLEDIDHQLRESGLRKQKWEVVRTDKTGLLTSFGQISYLRTYFKPKRGGKRKYLVDEIFGISPHDRVSADVVINVLEEASDSSYRKGGEKAAYTEEISKQAVKNKIHDLEIVQPPVIVEKKKEIKVLFIEADEDHVAQQGKKPKSKGGEKVSNTLMPKLVYVHEGIDYEKSTKKRRVLKDVRHFGGLQKSEDLWIEVSKYIDEVYDIETVETIYISGDGASWIKQGLNWIPKSQFVLDNYHMNKYIRAATAHLDDEAITQGLKDALDEADKEMMIKVFKRILELTETGTKRVAVNDAKRYLLNNWAGIEIKVDNREIVGCSAEGHVSHVLSDRLSSRPMGWSAVGVDKMAQLRVFKKNGGKIYDLVMAQKKKKQKEQQHAQQDELIRELRASNKRDNVWNSKVTVLNKGHKTTLYSGLRAIIGM
jgi:hypothetical protein